MATCMTSLGLTCALLQPWEHPSPHTSRLLHVPSLASNPECRVSVSVVFFPERCFWRRKKTMTGSLTTVLRPLPQAETFLHVTAAAGVDLSVSEGAGQPVLNDEDAARIRAEVSRKIRKCGKVGKLSEAMDTMKKMQAAGVAPDTLAITALVDCCVRCNNVSLAEQVFSSMFCGDLKPDAIAFGVLLRAYGATNPPQWMRIQQLLARMESDYGVKLTTATFNELIEICARNNDIAKGMELLEKMEGLHLEPDWFTFEATKRRRTLRSHLKKVFGK